MVFADCCSPAVAVFFALERVSVSMSTQSFLLLRRYPNMYKYTRTKRERRSRIFLRAGYRLHRIRTNILYRQKFLYGFHLFWICS